MNRLNRISSLFLLLSCGAVAQQAQPKPTTAVIRAAHMLEVKSGRTIDNPVIVISGGKITALNGPAPADATVIDLAGMTLVPGLIDAHTHLTGEPKFGYEELSISVPKEALIVAKNARVTLMDGFT